MERSHFDGTVLQLFGYRLLAGLLTAVTLGIGYPWALCMLQRWEAKHTLIESKRLKFNGTGLQLLGMWIMLAIIPLVILLTAVVFMYPFAKLKSGSVVVGLILIALIILAFFYGYFVQIQIKKWTIKHTEFEVHLLQDAEGATIQSEPGYTHPGPAPSRIPYQAPEKDWVDKLEPIMPLIYVLWCCGLFAATWGILSLIFK